MTSFFRIAKVIASYKNEDNLEYKASWLIMKPPRLRNGYKRRYCHGRL